MSNKEIVSQLTIICRLCLTVWNTLMDTRNNNTDVVLSLLIMQLARSSTIVNSQMMPKRPLAANIISKSWHEKKDFRSKPIMQIMVYLCPRMIVKNRSKQMILVELELNIRMELLDTISKQSHFGYK